MWLARQIGFKDRSLNLDSKDIMINHKELGMYLSMILEWNDNVFETDTTEE